jgi:hypothetical protein
MIVLVSGIAIGGARNVPPINHLITINGNRPSIAINIENPEPRVVRRKDSPGQSNPVSVQSTSVLGPKLPFGLDRTEFRNQWTGIGLDRPVHSKPTGLDWTVSPVRLAQSSPVWTDNLSDDQRLLPMNSNELIFEICIFMLHRNKKAKYVRWNIT